MMMAFLFNQLGLRKIKASHGRALRKSFSPNKRRGYAVRSSQRMEMSKCVIVSKVTRYEYEKHSHDNASDADLERILKCRGSDFDVMMRNHREQKAFEEKVARSLRDLGLQVEMASRLTYKQDLIQWCDLVLPCGGDGTFLLAASRVTDNSKPVVGFNSAPHKSVGRLCLPTWCSNDVKGALKALREGRFKWMHRTRIRTTITCDSQMVDVASTPVDLHTQQYTRYPMIAETIEDSLPNSRERNANTSLTTKVLPYLALNEVFIGESLTSRVSLLQLEVDGGTRTDTKSSGVCVTTGTGSTSWHFSINCLRTHSILDLMNILVEEFNVPADTSLETARQVTEKYNQRLMFAPDAPRLAYSIREFITFEEWPRPRGIRVRDFASRVRVKSHCVDAGLVIDGSVSFPFNDGTEALMEINPQDTLMTVQMDDALAC